MENRPEITISPAVELPKLRAALAKLHESPETARVDAVVNSLSIRHFRTRGRPRIWVLRFAASAAAAALAAAVGLPFGWRGESAPFAGLVREDMNRDRRVDIRDALLLARRIEGNGFLPARWDLNDDRRVDQGDVDVVAMHAVKMRWTR